VRRPAPLADPRTLAPLLWALLGLFALRVAGQALVAAFDVRFLPPMRAWYSGLVPYPVLLPIQVVLLACMAAVALGFTRGEGRVVLPRPRLGGRLRVVAWLYAGAMAIRYAATTALDPERRWLGEGTIPIVFHWVLAAFLLALAHYHLRAGRDGGQE
jgi:hypothetical protein